MPDSIPWEAAGEFAAVYECRQVIIAAWDGRKSHVVTFGKSPSDSDQAAQGGNLLKQVLGWPDQLCEDVSPKVKALEADRDRLKAEAASARASLDLLRRAIDEVNPSDEQWGHYIVRCLNMLAGVALAIETKHVGPTTVDQIAALIKARPPSIDAL